MRKQNMTSYWLLIFIVVLHGIAHADPRPGNVWSRRQFREACARCEKSTVDAAQGSVEVTGLIELALKLLFADHQCKDALVKAQKLNSPALITTVKAAYDAVLELKRTVLEMENALQQVSIAVETLKRSGQRVRSALEDLDRVQQLPYLEGDRQYFQREVNRASAEFEARVSEHITQQNEAWVPLSQLERAGIDAVEKTAAACILPGGS